MFYFTDAAECDNGWAKYKDEICIRAFTTDLITFDEAKDLCSSQGTSASLLMVKEPELKDLLTTITDDIYDNLWLGGKYDISTSQFRWINGEPLTYTNWADGFPRNDSDTEVCILLRPTGVKDAKEAKWEDSACQRRNLAFCQKTLTWTLDDAVNEIIRNRKELERLEDKLTAVENRVVPVGSIYIEYYNQPSPLSLWPELSWQDITATYAGLFFRALGGNSNYWGSVQAECAPRISRYAYTWSYEPANEYITDIPPSGWSDPGQAGEFYINGDRRYENLHFYTQSCEVRPKNQAVKIWKRVS